MKIYLINCSFFVERKRIHKMSPLIAPSLRLISLDIVNLRFRKLATYSCTLEPGRVGGVALTHRADSAACI